MRLQCRRSEVNAKKFTQIGVQIKMYETEIKILDRLKKIDRVILPDRKREIANPPLYQSSGDHVALPLKGRANSSTDLFDNKNQKTLVQRRFYDENGNPEQDFDYKYRDSNNTHLFPHIHLWINGERTD